jgi:MFS transporter, MHS family, proline/betaine transporter
VIFAWPLMAMMKTGDTSLVFLGQLGLAILIGTYGAVIPITMCEIFPRGVRCSAVSTAYNICVGLAGGTAPAVCEWMITRTGYMLFPALYIMLAAAFSALAALSIHAESRKAISDSVIPHLANEPAT